MLPAPAAVACRTGQAVVATADASPGAGLHLLVGGRRIDAELQDGLHVFRLPVPARDLRLVSRADRPAEIGQGDDPRLLGFGVTSLALQQDGIRLTLPLDAAELIDGFHPVEDGHAVIWTDGAAVLPDSLFAGIRGDVRLVVGGLELPCYRTRDARAAEATALFLDFESLGDDCEFGLAQRHFDAEPASLLRWASTDAARLAAGLACGFDGLGDPRHTRLDWADDVGEYKLVDPRYLRLHTWAQTRLDPAAEAAMLAAGCARIRLLRRKLLADIAAARRIFVFKDRQGAGMDGFLAVHAALRCLGPATLLCVQQGAGGSDVGRVDWLGDGLCIGHIDRFVLAEGPYDAWRAICANARRLCRAQTPG